jgi:hypothetical protein
MKTSSAEPCAGYRYLSATGYVRERHITARMVYNAGKRRCNLRFLFAFFLAAIPTVQGPGDGFNLAPSAPREIKTLYWELFKTTEIWVRLSPEGKDNKPAPVSLIFYVTFSGKELSSEPTQIAIRAWIPHHDILGSSRASSRASHCEHP